MLLRTLRRFCAPVKPVQAPRLTHLDLTPFKYGYEKEMFYSNYTTQELFGETYSRRHSPAIRKQMTLDTYAFWAGFLFFFATLTFYGRCFKRVEESWQGFREGKATVARRVPDHALAYPGMRLK